MTMVLFKKTKTKNTSSMTLINKKSNCLLKKKQPKLKTSMTLKI